VPAKGDDLERLNALVDFELFRAALETVVPRADRSKGGRPTTNPRSILMTPPAFDNDPRFLERVDLAFQQFVAKLRVETLATAILPWTARLNVSGPGADSGHPILHGLGDKLRAIVRLHIAAKRRAE
jgi:hypothetical protein